jgi:hypothetical protein
MARYRPSKSTNSTSANRGATAGGILQFDHAFGARKNVAQTVLAQPPTMPGMAGSG